MYIILLGYMIKKMFKLKLNLYFMKGSHVFRQWATVSQFSTLIKQMSSSNDSGTRSEKYRL